MESWDRYFRCWIYIGKRIDPERNRWRVVVERIRDGAIRRKVVFGTWYEARDASDAIMEEMGI